MKNCFVFISYLYMHCVVYNCTSSEFSVIYCVRLGVSAEKIFSLWDVLYWYCKPKKLRFLTLYLSMPSIFCVTFSDVWLVNQDMCIINVILLTLFYSMSPVETISKLINEFRVSYLLWTFGNTLDSQPIVFTYSTTVSNLFAIFFGYVLLRKKLQ